MEIAVFRFPLETTALAGSNDLIFFVIFLSVMTKQGRPFMSEERKLSTASINTGLTVSPMERVAVIPTIAMTSSSWKTSCKYASRGPWLVAHRRISSSSKSENEATQNDCQPFFSSFICSMKYGSMDSRSSWVSREDKGGSWRQRQKDMLNDRIRKRQSENHSYCS